MNENLYLHETLYSDTSIYLHRIQQLILACLLLYLVLHQEKLSK